MATYDSIHTGEQVDEAVDIVLSNKNKGSNVQPIYLDAYGEAKNVNVDAAPTQDSQNLVQSGGVFTQLSTKYAKADISTDDNLGTSNVLIPSQGAVKAYVDNELATKQDIVTAGDGIVKDGNTLSISTDNDFMTVGKLDNKWNHFSSSLGMGYGTEIIEKMEKAKKSSFGRDKFTIVGSPIITDDGVASGFSSSNFLKCGKFDWTKPFEINFIYTPRYNSSNGQYLLSMNGIGADGLTNGLEFNFNNNNQTYAMAWNVVGTYGGATGLTVSNIPFSTSLRVKLSYDGTTYSMSYKGLNDESWTIKQYTSQNTIPTTEDLVIGYCIYRAWQGSIDLKQFSITVDGEEVFTGNKTGVDILKSDNYDSRTTLLAHKYDTHIIYSDGTTTSTVLYNADGSYYTGSDFTITDGKVYYGANECPYVSGSNITLTLSNTTCDAGVHINDEGIASNFFDTNRYLRHTQTLDLSKSFKIQIKVRGDVQSTNPQEGAFSFNDTGWYNYILLDSAYCRVYLNYADDTQDNVYLNLPTGLHSFYIEFSWDGSTYRLAYSSDGENWMTQPTGTRTSSKALKGYSSINTVCIGKVFAVNYGALKHYSVDLNCVKIYSEGNLVYQPMLRIPYTQTKDGKKIVDFDNKAAVQDEYTQAGFTPYYTLDNQSRGNYRKFGSVTVSSDWIASNFNNSSNYLTPPSNIGSLFHNANTWRIELKVKYTTATSNFSSFFVSASGRAITIGKAGSNFYVDLSSTGNSWDIVDARINATLEDETMYKAVVEFNGSQYIASVYTLQGVLVGSRLVLNSSAKVAYQKDYIIGYANPTLVTEIDLKDFKIYVDGKLAYQAVIPPNYTMATVKESAIVDSYDNGINKWTKYANLNISQQGSCTSGTAVTFAKPFRDANYALSVPYTSGTKTATGFTPSFTDNCDYIAKGKCNLNFPQE